MGQPNSPFPPAPAGKTRAPLDLFAAGLVILALLLGLGRLTWYIGPRWLMGWPMVTWLIVIAISVAGWVLVLMNRNRTTARNTVLLAAGIIFIGQVGTLNNSMVIEYTNSGLLSRGNWLAIPAALASLAAIVMVYVAGRSDAPRSTGPVASAPAAQPGWPQQPGPAQAPQWPQPIAQNPQSPNAFPALQPPGYALPTGYQAQPGFAPQPPQQPHPSMSPQQPAYGAPQAPGAPGGQASIPQPPNVFGQPQNFGAEPTVLRRPDDSEVPPTTVQRPDSAAASALPSAAPSTHPAPQPSAEVPSAQPGTPPPAGSTS